MLPGSNVFLSFEASVGTLKLCAREYMKFLSLHSGTQVTHVLKNWHLRWNVSERKDHKRVSNTEATKCVLKVVPFQVWMVSWASKVCECFLSQSPVKPQQSFDSKVIMKEKGSDRKRNIKGNKLGEKHLVFSLPFFETVFMPFIWKLMTFNKVFGYWGFKNKIKFPFPNIWVKISRPVKS
jgi:hypothetical protein